MKASRTTQREICATVEDVRIYGHSGFYSIFAVTDAAVQWFDENVPSAIEGTVYCDDTRMTQDIADAAAEDDLVVTVNDVVYRPEVQS